MDGITENEVNLFLREIQPMCDGTLGEIQKQAMEEKVPIIPPEVVRMLGVLLKLKQPKSILEVGTAVAFSSSFMSQYIPKDGTITTIERFDVMKKQAQVNIKKMGLENVINMLEGDAAEVLPTLTGPYDVIFLDAAKAQYNVFLPECIRLLPVGGILIADNVLQGGFIAQSRFEVPRRQRTIHKRMRNFLWNISHSNVFESSIIPIGDGVAICYKVADEKGE
jgi:predicted O-methyltransferase YrrM